MHNIPQHIAIVMDGNGRWAHSRFRPRIWGHVRGSQVVSTIVEAANDIGVKSLTLYAFSTENWSRPVDEVKILIKILKKFLIKEEQRIIKNNIKFKVIGDTTDLSSEIVNIIHSLENRTKNASGLNLTFAFSYGGRKEIIDSINNCIDKNPRQKITEKDLSSMLYRPEIGDVDLLIRTGGDLRISNFLLWQIAYAELFFTKTQWPDFTPEEFNKIILEVSSRERRFGNLGDSKDLNSACEKANLNKIDFKNQISVNHV
jgi:undecaprenyl diphosphate synthase